MQAAARRPRTNHLDLAQRILDVARQRGFEPGARLAEQQIASLCNVSRTPVRAALRLLADQGVRAAGSRKPAIALAIDPADAGGHCRRLAQRRGGRSGRGDPARPRRRAGWTRRSPSSGLMRGAMPRRKTVLKCAKETGGRAIWLERRPASPGCSGRRRTVRTRWPKATSSACCSSRRRLLAPGFRLRRRAGGGAAARHGGAAGAAGCRLRHHASSSASTSSSTA